MAESVANAAASSSKTRSEAKTSVDLADIVKRYVWNQFISEKPIKYLLLKEKDVEFRIEWKDVRFVHDDPKYSESRHGSTSAPKQRTLVLYSTTFNNNTVRPQRYTFKTERSTTSTLQVEVEECVTIEHELSLSLKTPGELIELGAGFKRENAITTAHTETEEDTLTWGGDSEVEVAKQSAVIMSLEIDERTDDRAYQIVSHVYGPVNVNMLRRKDQKLIRTYGWLIEEIIDSTATTQERKILKVDKTKNLFPFKVISYTTRGTAIFKYAAQQHISLVEKPLSPGSGSGGATSQSDKKSTVI